MRRAILSGLLAATAWAGPCEDRFVKNGNVLSGTTYQSTFHVADVSLADAVAQMRAIAIQKKLDVLTEDPKSGAMLIEDRESMRHKPIPYVVSMTPEGNGVGINMLVKLNKGAIAKSDGARSEICSMLTAVLGGEAGRTAAASGANLGPSNESRKVDAFVLSMELARQAQESAESIPLRLKGRAFTISGRVEYVIKDGDVYRVAFQIPEPRDRALRLPSDPPIKMDVSCLMAPSHSAWSIALRPGEKIRLTGTYSDFDQFKHVVWFGGCRPD